MDTSDVSSGLAARRAGLAALSALLMVVVVALSGLPARADRLDELEAQQRDLASQQEEYARQREQVVAALEGTNAALAETYLSLQDINARLPIAQAELDAAIVTLQANQREARAVADRLAVAQDQESALGLEIAAGRAEEAKIRLAIGELARTTYRDGMDLSTLSVVLEATTPQELADRYSLMDAARRTQIQALTDLERAIAVRRNAQARLEAVRERIAELKVEADAAVDAAAAARDEAAARTAEIEQLKRDAESTAVVLESQRSTYQTQQAQIDADDQAVAGQIAALAAAEAAERERIAAEEAARAAAARAAAAAGGSQGSASGGGSGSSPALLIPPIKGPLHVTSPYGYRVYPITGGWFMHKGVDLRSACGSPQYASAAGTVVKVANAASNGTHGNQVIINHGVLGGRSTVTVYNHLSRFGVGAGQRVEQGQVIGYTGATGDVTGCHVHFELWLNGATVDPMNYI